VVAHEHSYAENYNEEKHYSISVSEAVETPKVKHTEASNVRYSISTSTSYAGHDIDFSKLSQYLDDSRSDSFVERLLRLMREKELRAPSVYRAANISKQLYSKMISNLYYQPSRDTAIALAFALRLTFEQAQDFIGRAGFQLTHSDERDVILEFFFKEKYYKLLDINVVLHEMGKKPLGY
ncbi:MAG: helix-turn-helix transcriptional regulator, partial [bacterium]|nr:helix-turn-helix transcriptional regulator [bacterium]